jgi:hypothetical protein
MGSGYYDSESRVLRAKSLGYTTTHASDARVFKQAASRTINQGMDPTKIELRECRDNDDHPNTFPVILALDVTGSMGNIPVELVRNDLPHLMERLLAIHPDIALMFIAVGDHECDHAPLQVGQFEASDALLDHWLTHTWIEGGGGGNMGESYALPWLFAASTVVTDAWEKRGQKGLLITIGDEPILPEYPASRMERIFSEKSSRLFKSFQGSMSKDAILAKAEEKWDIHHIAMRPLDQSWTFLGDRFHQIPKSPHVVDAVANIIQARLGSQHEQTPVMADTPAPTPSPANPSIPTPL